MMRLNKKIRTEIIGAVLAKSTRPAIATAESLFNKALVDEFKSKLPEGFEKAAVKNPEWFLGVGLLRLCRGYGVKNITYRTSDTLKAPHNVCAYGQFDVEEAEASHNLRHALKNLESAKQHEKDLKVELNSILMSVTTFKRFQEVWPDVDKYYKLPEKSPVNAVAITTDRLTNLLSRAQ